MDEIRIKALIDTADSAKTVGDLKKSLKELKSAALQVEEGTSAFSQLTNAAGKLQDRVNDLNDEIKFLSEGNKLKQNITGIIGVMEGAAGAFALVQGSMALFGSESKDLEKTLIKVQSAVAVLNGLQAVANTLDEKSTAILFIKNAQQKLSVLFKKQSTTATAADTAATIADTTAKTGEAAATGLAALAQRALNAAMNANPIAILIGLITTIVGAFFAFGNSADDATESQKALNDEIGKMKQEADVELASFNSQIKALRELKTGSEDRAILIDRINEKYGLTLKNLSDENEFLKQIKIAQDDYIEGSKRRLLVKIGEAKAEQYLIQAGTERLKNQKLTYDLNNLIIKQDAAKRAGNQDSVIRLQSVIDGIQEEISLNEKVALGYEAKAEKILNANANLLTKETAQERAEREKREKERVDADKKIADDKKKEAAKTKKEKLDAQKKAQEEAEALAKKHQDALAKIDQYILKNEMSTAQESLNAWDDSYYKRLAQLKLTLAQSDTEIKNQLSTEIQALLDANDTKLTVGVDISTAGTGISDAGKSFIANNATIANKIAQANVSALNLITANVNNNTKQQAQLLKDHLELVKEEIKKTTNIALATDEYKRYFKFVVDQNNKMSIAKRQAAEEEKQMILDTSDKRQKDIKKYGEEVIKQNKLLQSRNAEIARYKTLLETSTGDEADIYKGVIKDLEDLNVKSSDEVDKLMSKINELNNIKIDPSANMSYTLQVIGSANDLMNHYYKDLTENQKSFLGISIDKVLDNYEKLKNATAEPVELIDKNGIVTIKETQGQLELAEKALNKFFDLDRDLKNKSVGQMQSTNYQLAVLYQDKYNLVTKTEDEINKKITENADLLASVPELVGKKFATNVTDAKTQFGLDELLKIDPKGQLGLSNALTTSLTKRFELLKSLEDKAYQDSLNSLFVQLDTKEITQEEYNKKAEILDVNHQENMLIIDVTYGEKGQKELSDNLIKKNNIVDQAYKDRVALVMKNVDAVVALEKAGMDLILQLQKNALDQQDRASQQRYDDEVARINDLEQAYKDSKETRTAAEQQELDKQAEFDLMRKNAEDKRNQEKNDLDKKAFEANKMNQIGQIAINTAVAVSKAIAEAPITFGLPWSAYALVQGGLEAALVGSQQFVPSYATGGIFTGNGAVSGPGTGTSDSVNAKLSNGEVVINAKSSKMFAPMLSAINQAGGGVAIPHLANGGVYNTPDTTVIELGDRTIASLEYAMASNNEPVIAVVNESDITNAQSKTSKVKRRTRF